VASLRRTNLLLGIATVVALVAALTVLGLGPVLGNSGSTGTSSATSVPAYCVRPAGGFLIVVSQYGYNDSILQGAGPGKPWPIVIATQGQLVRISVCNTDIESHGFQVATYVQSTVNIIKPGEEQDFTFTANQEGTYGIYCAIPCDLHVFLQYGQLRVVT
jgi:FtsP/CotA-like multicopper oxidase with cupredoxin domain